MMLVMEQTIFSDNGLGLEDFSQFYKSRSGIDKVNLLLNEKQIRHPVM